LRRSQRNKTPPAILLRERQPLLNKNIQKFGFMEAKSNSRHMRTRLASLRQLQSATEEELSALLPSVLDKAFKGEL